MRSPRPSPPPLSESSPRKTSQSPRRRAGTRRRCCVRDTWGPVRFEVGATPRPHPTCAPTCNPRPHRTGAQCTFRRTTPNPQPTCAPTCNPRPHRTGAQCTFRRTTPDHYPPAPQHAIRAPTEQAHNAHSGAPPPTTTHLRPNRQSAPPPNRRTMHIQAHLRRWSSLLGRPAPAQRRTEPVQPCELAAGLQRPSASISRKTAR